jgi:hypothetical protein
MINRKDAQIMVDYYSKLIEQLTEAKLALLRGGAKSYTIGDRSLTRFDIDKLGAEIDDAVLKKAEYESLLAGRAPRKAVGVILKS